MISLKAEQILQLLSLIVTLAGGSFLGTWLSRKTSKETNAQTLIDQIQEERDYTNSQLEKRDERIEDLYTMYNDLQEDYREIANEKRTLEWELDNEMKKKRQLISDHARNVKEQEEKNEILKEENIQLQEKILGLERRVSDLENGLALTHEVVSEGGEI